MTNELRDLQIQMIQLQSKVNDGQQISHEEAAKRLENPKKVEDSKK